MKKRVHTTTHCPICSVPVVAYTTPEEPVFCDRHGKKYKGEK